jgi:hypothetical protein
VLVDLLYGLWVLRVMINKGFLNSRAATDASNLLGKVNSSLIIDQVEPIPLGTSGYMDDTGVESGKTSSGGFEHGNLPEGDGVHVAQSAGKLKLSVTIDNTNQFPSLTSNVGTSPPLHDNTSCTGVKSVTYAGATSNEPKKHESNFRRLESSNKRDDVDLSIPLKVVEEVNTRFENTLYGYFLGQRLAFPVVDYYVRNAWAKFGIQKVMMNAKGFFFFKFNSSKGVDDVLENGPWLIRNVPIILKPWTLNTNLLKEDLINIPVWVKFHDVPLAMFSDDGLSLLATLIGTPKRLDAFTNHMCKESWGRSSFARCMIDVKSEEVLRDCITVEIPLLDGTGSTIEKIRVEYEWKPPRCAKCKVFGHTFTDGPKFVPPTTQPKPSVNDGFQTVNNKNKSNSGGQSGPMKGGFTKPSVGKKMQYRPKVPPPEPKKVDANKKKTVDIPSTSGAKIVTSNQFNALNMDDTDGLGIPTKDVTMDMTSGSIEEAQRDVDAGSPMEVNKDESVKTGTTSQVPLVSDMQEPLLSDSMRTMEVGSTPVAEKISKLEDLLIDRKAILVDDAGHPIPSTSATKRTNPFSKVGDVEISDSDEDEVLDPFAESANLFGGGHERDDYVWCFDDT